VAVLATVFTAHGSYASPHAFLAGLRPAIWVGVAVLAAGAIVVAAFPFRSGAGSRAEQEDRVSPERSPVLAATAHEAA
jgi:hypothetical protein